MALSGVRKLVAHVGQELVLEAGGALELGIGQVELDALVEELGFALLALGNVARDGGEALDPTRGVKVRQHHL